MSEELVNSGGSEGIPGDSGTASSSQPGSSEQSWDLKWNGKVEKVPHSRALELAQKGFDYTQKMQALAREREAFGTERQRYDQALAEVRGFLNDPRRMREYLTKLEAASGQATAEAAASGDPDDVVTARQLRQQLEEARTQLAGMTQQQMLDLKAQIQVDTLAGQYSNEFGLHINGLKQQFPELRTIPRVDSLLKDEVKAMGPRDIHEAKSMMVEVAKQYAQNVRSFVMEQRKESGGQGAAPLRNGIEPPGGGTVLPPGVQNRIFKKGVMDPGFKQDVLAELQAMEAASRR